MPPRKRARGASSSEASGPTVNVGSAMHTMRPAREAKLWREGLLLDCEVHVEERSFRAHRLVLVSSSEYMRGCFCSGLSETASASVTLEDMPSAVFEAILTWMYDAVVEVEEALLPELLSAAVRLQVQELPDDLDQLLVERLTAANAVGAWILADSLMRPAVVEAAKKLVLESFGQAAASDDFTRLPVAALESLLSSDELVVKDEAECFRALTRWLAAQQPAAAAEIQARLLGCVRFDLMSHDFVQQHVNTDPLVGASARNVWIVAKAFQRSTFAEKSRPRVGSAVELRFDSAFDTNGVLYHIGTEGGTTPYVNPHDAGRVVATASTFGPFGSRASRFVQHRHPEGGVYNITSNQPNSWMAVDLGERHSLVLTHYCLRSTRSPHKPRTWTLQGSNDGNEWTVLKSHTNDSSLAEQSNSEAAWPVEAAGAYRHFRIRQTGWNSHHHHNLACSGIEIYGMLKTARA